MKMIEVEIPEEEMLEVFRYDIETKSRKEIIIELLSNEDIHVSEERFQKYQQEYADRYVIFDALKQRLQNRYILPVIGDHQCTWSLSYQTSKIAITIEDDE